MQKTYRTGEETLLRAYLPATLVEQWALRPEQHPLWGVWLKGSLMFCDVSGFTAMSEKLAQVGREGAELIASVLNGFFERMLAIADGWGGAQMKFGGDAMLLLFSGGQHADRAPVETAGQTGVRASPPGFELLAQALPPSAPCDSTLRRPPPELFRRTSPRYRRIHQPNRPCSAPRNPWRGAGSGTGRYLRENADRRRRAARWIPRGERPRARRRQTNLPLWGAFIRGARGEGSSPRRTGIGPRVPLVRSQVEAQDWYQFRVCLRGRDRVVNAARIHGNRRHRELGCSPHGGITAGTDSHIQSYDRARRQRVRCSAAEAIASQGEGGAGGRLSPARCRLGASS